MNLLKKLEKWGSNSYCIFESFGKFTFLLFFDLFDIHFLCSEQSLRDDINETKKTKIENEMNEMPNCMDEYIDCSSWNFRVHLFVVRTLNEPKTKENYEKRWNKLKMSYQEYCQFSFSFFVLSIIIYNQ